MQGAVRFGLFCAIIALCAVGFYAHGLRQTVAQQQATISAVMAERDAQKTKAETSSKQASDHSTALKAAESKIADLQAQLEAAKTPPRRRR